jgi:ABC-type antimicrobial peptide transport system permease subunit
MPAFDSLWERLSFPVVLVVSAAAILNAASPQSAPNVTLTATGTFSSSPVSGPDTLRLAGEPFTIAVVANSAAVPIQHGANWALFSPLNMTGTVHSGLLGSSPINIASGAASILQAVGPDYDPFETGFPVRVVGISLTIDAQITLPEGTLTKQLIHPFAAVALSPANNTISYSDGTNTTVLTVASGTLVATIPTGNAAYLESSAQSMK